MTTLGALVQFTVERSVASHSAFVNRMVFLVQSLRTANRLATVLKACLFPVADELASQSLILLAARNF